ncbi:hypothetical protein ORIO_19735 (plasmid) [Cereibacter azotoformans]|uniref:hypothetical protein n=1 Tax=Cereibacter azotoformans TaxID=43057 RepID=UPI001EEA19EB|nr:hypothetical protein [Cereibacter azotoformans]ULB12050.1 hypothetical protein ORIO_19735 [Cereibacter azotoformans]
MLIDPVWLPRGAERAPRFPGAADLTISFHSYGPAAENLLRCKESYIPPFYAIDPMGYSCFSLLAKQPALFHDAVRAQDPGRAEAFRRQLSQELRCHNRSKYPQADLDGEIGSGHVFVPLQMLNDSVAKAAWLDPRQALYTVVQAASARGMTTVVKRHPHCSNGSMARLLTEMSQRPDVIVSTASIHALIGGAALVVGGNSGVLFEALVQGKPVVSYAASDFSQAVQQVRSREELAAAIATPTMPQATWRDCFLLWYLTEYCVRADDVPAIRRRILTALSKSDSKSSTGFLPRPTYGRSLYLVSLIDRVKRRFF